MLGYSNSFDYIVTKHLTTVILIESNSNRKINVVIFTMHKYNNKPYGMPVMTRIIPRVDVPPIELNSINTIQNTPIEHESVKDRNLLKTNKLQKYLPGERLLKSLNKDRIKNKPLNMKVIKNSIEDVLSRLELN